MSVWGRHHAGKSGENPARSRHRDAYVYVLSRVAASAQYKFTIDGVVRTRALRQTLCACGEETTTSQSIEGVKSDIGFIAAAVAASIPAEKRKSVYFEISPAPYLYSTGSGTYLSEMIEWVGGVNVLASQDSWISVEGESIVAANPDVIFTNVNYTDDPIGEILARDGWAGVSAVANEDVYYIDNMASSLPNQNIVVAMRQMLEALYPDYYHAA